MQVRVTDALDAWFNRHPANFHPSSLEVLHPGEGASQVDKVKRAYCRLLERAISESPELSRLRNVRAHVAPTMRRRILRNVWQVG